MPNPTLIHKIMVYFIKRGMPPIFVSFMFGTPFLVIFFLYCFGYSDNLATNLPFKQLKNTLHFHLITIVSVIISPNILSQVQR